MAARAKAHEKVKRDRTIVAERARGLRWSTIAARHGLSERQCRSIWAQGLAMEELRPADVVTALKETFAQFDAAIEELAVLAEATRHDAVKLGAIRGRLAAMAERTELLRVAGLLPCHPEGLATELDVRRTADAIIGLFIKYGLPDAAREELVEALRPRAIVSGSGEPVY